VERKKKLVHVTNVTFLVRAPKSEDTSFFILVLPFQVCKCQEKRIPSAFEEFSKFAANFVEFVPRDLALSQPIITFPHNSIAPEITAHPPKQHSNFDSDPDLPTITSDSNTSHNQF
jgi:hypothetical protein